MDTNLFKNTMAEMTWKQIEDLAKQDALVIWPMGVIEEHGHHLPIGTDAYLAYAQACYMAEEMKEQLCPCVIAPPFYWGICSVLTKNFPGSFTVREETLKAMVADTLSCFEKAGFRRVVLANAHGDPVHCKVICEVIGEYNQNHLLKAKWMTYACDLEMDGFSGKEDYILVLPDDILMNLGEIEGELADSFDVHAGAYETANMMDVFPQLVNQEVAKNSQGTYLSGEQIGRWLSGEEQYTSIIKDGHAGNPADHVKIHSTFEKYCRAIARGVMEHRWS